MPSDSCEIKDEEENIEGNSKKINFSANVLDFTILFGINKYFMYK